MEGFSFTGCFDDGRRREPIVWEVSSMMMAEPNAGNSVPGFWLRTVIRDVAFAGPDFESLEPQNRARAEAAGLALSQITGDLADCRLSGDLPCAIDIDGARRPGVVAFVLDDLTPDPAGNLHLKLTIRGTEYRIVDRDFEDGLQALGAALPSDVRLVCCLTCLLSDYSPAGHGLIGMRCHRNAKEQYLAAREKADRWSIPVTEHVMETYLCPRYEPRIPGTGYRG